MVKRKKIALASALEKALTWRRDDTTNLTLVFRTRYEASAVRREESLLREALAELAGTAVRFVTEVAEKKPAAEESGKDPRVEEVLKVFRGQIVEGGDE